MNISFGQNPKRVSQNNGESVKQSQQLKRLLDISEWNCTTNGSDTWLFDDDEYDYELVTSFT
jgi:hypothetical protein